MKFGQKLILGLVLICGCESLGIAQSNLPHRRQVEHGTDVDAVKIQLKPTVVSVEELLALRDKTCSKMDFAKFRDRRFKPFEMTVYRISGTLISIRVDKEGDLNFVVKGRTGARAIIEIPEADECKGSPFLAKMIEVRQILETRFHPKRDVLALSEPITVEGIGYLGSRRKAGDKPFGETVRLMPAIRVEFGVAH